MQKARRHLIMRLRPLVGAWFQVLFTLLLGVLFTFPSRYWFAIGLLGVFSLTGWCRQIQTGFLRSRPTQGSATRCSLTLTGLSPSTVRLPIRFSFAYTGLMAALQPHSSRNHCGLGSSAFARHYSRNHYCFLLLRVLRCFSSPGSPPALRQDDRSSTGRVPPFGHLRISARLQLPAAFRSLPRPSSPPRA